MKAATGEFDAFLYATVEHEDGTAPLSVLSLLARLDVDPWDEAARLAALPPKAAAGKMAKIIAGLPACSAAHVQSGALVTRLIALLPSGPGSGHRHSEVPAPRQAVHGLAPEIAAFAILAVIILGANWAMRANDGVAVSSAAVTATHGNTEPLKPERAGPGTRAGAIRNSRYFVVDRTDADLPHRNMSSVGSRWSD